MASFFTPASQKKPEPITWRVLGTSLIVGKYIPEKNPQALPEKNRKIAAFDLVSRRQFPAWKNLEADRLQDSTVIKTASGNVFPKSATDWRWWDAVVPGRLRELSSDGYAGNSLHTGFGNSGLIGLKLSGGDLLKPEENQHPEGYQGWAE